MDEPNGKTAGASRILLVEDNEMNRDMLSRRLARRGYEVEFACDGAEGFRMARDNRYDLVLLDMSLPEMDGWEGAREIRKVPGRAELPIIALTAHAMAGDRERAVAAGCNDYDTKPVELPRLLEKIEALLLRKGP
jgi:two-component system cell cycle response regulator DivK